MELHPVYFPAATEGGELGTAVAEFAVDGRVDVVDRSMVKYFLVVVGVVEVQ